MNYLIARKTQSQINEFIKEHPESYASQIAHFLNADPNYIRVLVREYKRKNNIKKSNTVVSKEFILYLKKQNQL